jgi:hypothetical protein
LFLFVICCLGPLALRAQEVSLLAGASGSVTGKDTSYGWQFDFRHEFTPRTAWSLGWINEGHLGSHHRDGQAVELWGSLIDNDTITVALGAGGYHYSDTQIFATGQTANVHGWTPIYSLSLTHYTASPWLFRLTANRINRAQGLASTTVLGGVGYYFGKEPRRRLGAVGPPLERTTAAEFTVFGGRSIVNTDRSETAAARAVEFRHGIGKNFDWTASWIDEGDPKVIRRQGLATQVWAVDSYFGRRVALGIGVGGYFYFDQHTGATLADLSRANLAVLVSPTVSFRFSRQIAARLTWNRVISDYNRDADVILLGLGYRWGRPE